MRRNRHLHPSRSKLASWIEGAQPHLDAHVEECLRCASKIEEIDSGSESSLGLALAQILAPPRNLSTQLTSQIEHKIESRSDLGLLGEMLGVPYQTVKVVSQGSMENG